MKSRVILLVFAVSSLILVSFMVPLALLLQQFTSDRAVSAGTIRAQYVAQLVTTLNGSNLRLALARTIAEDPAEPVTVFMPDGTRFGSAGQRTSGVELAQRGRSFTEQVPGGVTVLVAVQGLPGGTAVISTFIPDSQLRHNVTQAWAVLGAIGLGLLGITVIIAAQLSKSFILPIGAAARAADALAAGDLSARAPVTGPHEIRQVSNGLNRLAARIGELLTHERETLADLSHRLRTPLTALRIDAESIRGDDEAKLRVINDIDALTITVNGIIAEARRPSVGSARAACDACAVIRERTAFWLALAEDQQRWMTVDIPRRPLPVRVPAEDLVTCANILLENVFAHTAEGTSFAVRVSERAGGGAWLVVADNGPGFSNVDQARRGESMGGSTGLGLDIARRIAEASGGSLTLGRSPHGGGAVTVGFGPVSPGPRRQRHVRARRPQRLYRSAEDERINDELARWASYSEPGSG